MSLRRSARAEEDLIEIWLHIAPHNLAAADRLLDRLDDRCRLLATQPRSGPTRNELGDGIRCVAVGEYLVFYRIDGRDVEMLRVLHGRRNISAEDFAN